MPCRLFIAARNISASVSKGTFSSVREYLGPDQNLGPMVLPNFVNIIITDATKPEMRAMALRQQWLLRFKHEITKENPTSYTIRTSVDDEFLDVSQTSKDVMKNSMIAFLQDEGATSVTFATDSVTFKLEKPADLVALKSKFADVFDTIFHPRKFYATEAEVDTIIGLGGEVELTKAQVISRIKNRLED